MTIRKLNRYDRTNKMDDKFLTVQEVALTLKVNKMTIYRYVKAGKIQAIKIGKDIRIRTDEFDNFLKQVRIK